MVTRLLSSHQTKHSQGFMKTRRWLNQPIWKNARQKGSFPPGSGWKKNLWNHHRSENNGLWTIWRAPARRKWYGWWKNSCTTWEVKNPVNDGINYQPQLVSLPDFWLPSTTYQNTVEEHLVRLSHYLQGFRHPNGGGNPWDLWLPSTVAWRNLPWFSLQPTEVIISNLGHCAKARGEIASCQTSTPNSLGYTPEKTNMEPNKWRLGRWHFPFQLGGFWGSMLIFRGCTLNWKKSSPSS